MYITLLLKYKLIIIKSNKILCLIFNTDFGYTKFSKHTQIFTVAVLVNVNTHTKFQTTFLGKSINNL
jgi:hypothetical protein